MAIVAFPASAIVSGTLAAARGGLGADASGFAGFVAMNSGVATARTLTGTTNQVSVTNTTGGGNPVFSTPQNIHTGATPQFTRMGLGDVANTSNNLRIAGTTTGAASHAGISIVNTFDSTATTAGVGVSVFPFLAAASFTMPNLRHFQAVNASIGAGAAVTTQSPFYCPALSGATNNYGFTGLVAAGANNYNAYFAGTANCLTNGAWLFGQMAAPTPGTNQGAIYAKDVAGTAEMCAKDEANNETQLTPHPGDLMSTHAATMAMLGLPSVPVTWFYDSFQHHVGKRVSVDMGAVVRCVEYLMSKDRGSPISLLQVAEFAPVETWHQRVDREQADFTAKRAEYVRQVVAAANTVPGLQPSPLPKWDGPSKFVRKSQPSYLGA